MGELAQEIIAAGPMVEVYEALVDSTDLHLFREVAGDLAQEAQPRKLRAIQGGAA